MAVDLVKKPNQLEEYTNLAGISNASKNNLNYYGQGYQQSQRVTDAQDYLQSIIDQQPGEYQSKYAGKIEDLYDQIMNRPKYSYDVNKDPAYQQYKQHYTTLGQRAMQDTVGNAAALTGGYGNSWAATAGSQAYQQYLQQLNDMVPQLEQNAYNRYSQEGQDMRQNLSLAQGLEDEAYGRYRDTVGDWQQNRSFAANRYDQEYQNDYNQWMNMLNYWSQLAQAENQNYWTQKNYDFQMQQYKDSKKRSGGGKKKGTMKVDPAAVKGTKKTTYEEFLGIEPEKKNTSSSLKQAAKNVVSKNKQAINTVNSALSTINNLATSDIKKILNR